MEIKDLTEGEDFTEIKKDQVEPDPELEDVLSENIRPEEKVESQPINADDFTSDFTDKLKDPKDDAAAPVEKEKVKSADKVTETNAAAARLFKADTVMTTINAIAGRGGKMLNKNNPDCLKLDEDDQRDLGTLLRNTAEEENWSRFPTKWLLLFLFAVIIATKIVYWNKPTKHIDVNAVPNDFNQVKQEQVDAGQQKIIDQLQESLKELRDQNRMMQTIIDKKIDPHNKNNSSRHDGDPPVRIYKGYDLEKISFTEKGALVDPDKAGQKGYTDDGKKVGLISHQDKDIHRQWNLYQKFIKEEEIV